MIIAGIGSRKAPESALDQAEMLARMLTSCGARFRSGGAVGMDTAFADGSRSANGMPRIFRPIEGTIPEQAFEIARTHHPAWLMCKPYVRRLMARNAQIILGQNLDEPADLVLYWNPLGSKTGGTLHSLRIAAAYDIPMRRVDEWRDWIADAVVASQTGETLI